MPPSRPTASSPNPVETAPAALPDETFWQKYSPHNEVPLSVAAGVVLHLFVVLLLAMFGSLILGWNTDKVTPTVDNILFAGGGGTPGGEGQERAANVNLNEAVEFIPKRDTELFSPSDPVKVPTSQKGTSGKQTANVKDLAPGKGGSGTGGGKGAGTGTGEGSGAGPGVMTKRAQRRDRWHLNLPVAQFAERLANIQATLVIPQPDGKFMIYRNLHQRTPDARLGTLEEVNRLNLIWYQNEDARALEVLASAIGLPSVPSSAAIFIPRGLEEEMLKKELSHKGLTEDQIAEKGLETSFDVNRRGGEWVVRVVDQRPKK